MTRSLSAGALRALLVVATLVTLPTLPHTAVAKDIGWVGLNHNMRVEGYFGRGERWNNSGNQLYFQFAGAFFGKGSPMGNLAGIEFDLGMGYDGIGYKDSDTVLGDIGFPMHLSVGFPVTLFRWFRGGGDALQIGFAPGFGINWQVAYTYLKLQAAFRLSRRLAVEGSYVWYPGAASSSVADTNASVNMATARGTLYFRPRGRGNAFLVFVEWMKSQRENEDSSGGNASKVLFNGLDPFGKTVREQYEGALRLGVGYAF